MESFSPLRAPAVATRNEARMSPFRAEKAPSCGRRRSEMSKLETALMLLMTPRQVSERRSRTIRKVPSIRSRTAYEAWSFGSMRMSLARFCNASSMIWMVRSSTFRSPSF